MKRIKVLYIDDERVNLLAFKASFRREFDIYTAASADEGIKILEQENIEIIISDQRMPEKTGVDFFESILESHPNPIRILITAYSDINAIVDAINKGKVYHYVTKPWNDFELKLAIENAHQLYTLRELNNKLNLKYQNIFRESTDPIVLFNTEGIIIDYNKSTLKLLNTEKDIKDRFFHSFLKYRSDAHHIINSIKEYGYIKDYECSVLYAPNAVKTCLISGGSVVNNNSEVISYQAIIKDITTHRDMEKNILKTIVDTQEDERIRISRELHDSLGQKLTATKIHFNILKSKINTPSAQIKKTDYEDIDEILDASIEEIRSICFNLMPGTLQRESLSNIIEDSFPQEIFADAEFDLNIEGDEPPLNTNFKISIFRIIQEFINNSLKHSEAKKISLDIYFKNSSLHILLRDNGKGFNVDKKIQEPVGNGLNNIISRIKAFNGRYKFTSKISNFTELEIHFLIHKPKNHEN